MILKCFNKTISIFITIIFLFGLFPPMIFASPSSSLQGEVKGFNKTIFDNSFTRADREINPERWLAEAKLGLTQAISSWELIAVNLYDNPLLLKEAKNNLEKWSKEELESRFSDWLIERFFGEAAEKEILKFNKNFADIQKLYSWHLDEEGNVIFDNKTGDPLVIRPTDDGREFSEDIVKWRNDANNIINSSNSSFENIITQLFPEILTYIPLEFRDSMSALIYDFASVKKNDIKREFENIAAREERIFTNRRTRDIWSLRSKSENESAKLFTERLIIQTDEICKAGIEELNIKIEQAEAGIGDLALLGEEWLRLYKEQFEKGLKAWEDAEERFFIRRIEWEQESLKLFSEGEEAWLSAFYQFEDERNKWELNARKLFQAGESLFINLSEEFEKNIKDAKKEFEINMALRLQEGTTKANALIDMYLTFSSTALSIKETINYYLKTFGYHNMDINDPAFLNLINDNSVPFKIMIPRYNDVCSLYSSYLLYMEKATEARDCIIENFAELLGAGTLKDILSPDMSSDDFYLDEYQIALVRAKALVLHLERKTAIAEAVVNYADDLSAFRLTEIEGIRAWEEAKNAYNKSLENYEIELNLLNEASAEIKNHQEILSALSKELKSEEEKLNNLFNEYNLLFSLSLKSNNTDFYSLDLNDKYNNLVKEYRVFEKTGEESIYKYVLLYGLMWGIANEQENTDIIWQESLEPLVSLFNTYGFDCETYYLPDVQDICEIIFNQLGDFTQNAAQFLVEFDNCFTAIPKWLEIEINNWKKAFIEYLAIYAFINEMLPEISLEDLILEQNELMDEYNELAYYFSTLEDIDKILSGKIFEEDEIIISEDDTEDEELISDDEIVKSEENILSDEIQEGEEIVLNEDIAEDENAEDNQKKEKEKILSFINSFLSIINRKFTLNYTINITAIWENLNILFLENKKHWRQSIINSYFDNIDYLVSFASSWTEGIFTDSFFNANYYTNRLNDAFILYSQKDSIDTKEDSSFFSMLYSNEYSLVDYQFISLLSQHNEVIKSLNNYELSKLTAHEALALSYSKNTELKAQEIIYNEKRDQYLIEADNFLEIGSKYDEQYNKLKTAYTQTDQKRFEYEIQDAIQRWASTSYLKSNIDELEDNRIKLQRAQAVLDVLSNLNNNEEERTYNDPEYNALYSAYEQSFKNKIITLEVINTLSTVITNENLSNAHNFNWYQEYLYELGSVYQKYLNYQSSEDRSTWSEKDLIMYKDGRLAFSINDSMQITGINAASANDLNNFFNTKFLPVGERYEISLYEEALSGLSQRMLTYFKDPKKIKTWSLARNHLISSLIEANGEISYLKNIFSEYGELTSNGSIGNQLSMDSVSSSKKNLYNLMKNKSIYSGAKDIYLNAWNSLSPEEKADLEFYIIISLSNTNSYIDGFSLVYTQQLYEDAYNNVEKYYNKACNESNQWYNKMGNFIWDEMKSVNKNTLNNIVSPYNELTNKINNWIKSLTKNIDVINIYRETYLASCKRLDLIENRTGENIKWEDIKRLFQVYSIKGESIDTIKTCWETMQSEISNKNYFSVTDALISLFRWTENKENNTKIAMNNYWNERVHTQQLKEYNFNSAVNDYISGNINLNSLKSLAKLTYGENIISEKNHFSNIYSILVSDISLFINAKYNFIDEFSAIGKELLTLTKNTIENRYLAEYSARESEWQIKQNGIMEKYYDWQNSAALILENGRLDWITSQQRMEDAYKQWYLNFHQEYERINNEWNEIYLAGLEDKEKWLEQAANTAKQASSDSFLSLVGTEGERLSRFIDTREPLGIRNSIPKAQSLLEEILQSSGIVNMTSAFNSLANYAGITSPLVRRGMGGVSSWDSASLKIAASDLAKKSNSVIANNEAKILADNVRQSIGETINRLTVNVKTANKNFREGIDDLFIFKGLWRKSGNNYVKDVVKGSTLFTPIISEAVTIEGYINYIMEPIKLQTNLEEYNLVNLNTIAINDLIHKAKLEVEKITSEIFGYGEKPKSIDSKGEKREQSPGKFGAYIGFAPDTKPDIGKKRNEMFYDEGTGELGRLMSDFIYWKVIDGMGNGEAAMAPWDKRMWNDEGSNFTAPSLSVTGQIAGAIVATIASIIATPYTGGASLGVAVGMVALIAGISTTNDLVFGALDVAFGYKTLDEAAFDVGKSYTINFASGLITAGFNGIGGAANVAASAASAAKTTASTIATQTLMAGVQTVTTGLATSVINGITYNSENGFGYSSEIVSAGMKSTFTNSLVSMTSTLTSSSLTAINSGFSHINNNKLNGFNEQNYADLGKLNGLAGSLAGQGVNYALGNDFTLNLLNFSLLSGNSNYNTGLLELHLGHDGTSMNFGTGGANVSIDNLAAVIRGAQVWEVNSNISKYIKNQSKENGNGFDSYVTLRAQYGYGDAIQKDQLFDILNGDVTLNTNAEGNYIAETTLDENNKKVINLAGYQQGMSTEDQFLLAVVLGHEAYRDGIITDNNYLETQTATIAHTKMALRIIAGGEKITINNNLMNDLTAYIVANKLDDISLFNNYVDTNYDSSADYWRVMMNANGGVDKILWDGDYSNVTIVNADGTERFLPLQSGSVTQALSAAIGNGLTKEQVNSIMLKSGLDFNNETKQWFAKEEYAVYTPPQIELPKTESNILQNIAEVIGNKATQALNAISNGLNDLKNFISGLFDNSNQNNDITENIKKGNTFTMKDSIENNILLYLLDNENHILGELLQQTDSAFASIPAIKEAGCNFLATLAYAQLVTGKALTAEQTMEIWREAEKNPDILKSGGFVQDQNKLAEMALLKLGRTDIGLNFGGAVNGKSSTLIGYRVTVDYNIQNVHHTTGDKSKQILWNPDTRNTNTEIKNTRSIYVYAKN